MPCLLLQETAPKIFKGTLRTHYLLFADAENATSKEVSQLTCVCLCKRTPTSKGVSQLNLCVSV